MMPAITAKNKWELMQPYVKTDFFHAVIEEIDMAPDFETTTNKEGVQLVMKLGKSIYGLSQIPDNWWKTIYPTLSGRFMICPTQV